MQLLITDRGCLGDVSGRKGGNMKEKVERGGRKEKKTGGGTRRKREELEGQRRNGRSSVVTVDIRYSGLRIFSGG